MTSQAIDKLPPNYHAHQSHTLTKNLQVTAQCYVKKNADNQVVLEQLEAEIR